MDLDSYHIDAVVVVAGKVKAFLFLFDLEMRRQDLLI